MRALRVVEYTIIVGCIEPSVGYSDAERIINYGERLSGCRQIIMPKWIAELLPRFRLKHKQGLSGGHNLRR